LGNGHLTEPTDEPDSLRREALAWVVRLRSGEATNADLADLQAWREQSSEHDSAFRQAATLWRDLKQTAEQVSRSQHGRRRSFGAVPTGRRLVSRRGFLGGAAAASVAAYLAYDPPMQLWPSFQELNADYRTAKGERRDIDIADGVTVTLNTMTSLSALPSGSDNPRFELIAGEVSVTAERAAGHPMTVQALDVQMVATKATFNTRCLDGEVMVTCIDGQVEVDNGQNPVRLEGGQQVAFSMTRGLGARVNVDSSETTAWRSGLLVVRDRPLADVVADVNRYRPGRIVVSGDELAKRLVNGTFHLDRLENFPNQVQQLFGANIRQLPGGLVILS
jgi:transmembrane sensor